MENEDFCWFVDTGTLDNGYISRETAREAGEMEARFLGVDHFYTATCTPYHVDVTGLAEGIINNAIIDANWECYDDSAVDWLNDVPRQDINDLDELLQKAFDKWLDDHPQYKHGLYNVDNVKKEEVPLLNNEKTFNQSYKE